MNEPFRDIFSFIITGYTVPYHTLVRNAKQAYGNGGPNGRRRKSPTESYGCISVLVLRAVSYMVCFC